MNNLNQNKEEILTLGKLHYDIPEVQPFIAISKELTQFPYDSPIDLMFENFNIRRDLNYIITNDNINLIFSKIGRLLYTMPDMIYSNMKQVAMYFEISISRLSHIVNDNYNELNINGLLELKGRYQISNYIKDMCEIFSKDDVNNVLDIIYGEDNNIKNIPVISIYEDLIKDHTTCLTLFTRQTIINVAMILKESIVARDIKHELLLIHSIIKR